MPPIDPNADTSMRPEPTHTLDDLLAALQAAHAAPEVNGWPSVTDLVHQTGLARVMVLRRLGTLHRRGELEVRRVMRLCIDGSLRQVPVYRTKPK